RVIQGVAEIIGRINLSAGRISEAVQQQTGAANASAASLSQASGGVGHIASAIAEVAQGATDMSRNTAEAAQGANDVSRNAAGAVFSGENAREFLRSTPADVVTLDVEMPGLDGLQTLEAVQRLNAARPPGEEIGAIMVSAFTRRGADVTVRALQAGAFDFVTKPTGPSPEANQTTLREELLPRIRACARHRISVSSAAGVPPVARAPLPARAPRRQSAVA